MSPSRPSPRSGQSAADAESRRLWRLAGLGGAMTSEILGGTLLGWVLDYFCGTKPTLLIVGTVVGVIVGMTSFIRTAIAQSQPPDQTKAQQESKPDSDPTANPPSPPDDPPAPTDETTP